MCKLCNQVASISDSHLLPSAIYRLLRDDDGPLPNPISIANGVAQTTSKELRVRLLCAACEQRFHRRGENWVLKRLYRGPGKFLLFDSVTKSPVHQSSKRGSVFELKRNPEVDVVGAALTSRARSLCIGNSEEGIVFIVDDIYADAVAKMAKVVKSARPVGLLSRTQI